MIKDFDRWNLSKKAIDEKGQLVDFHEREIWWCSVGVNVGSEQHSQSIDFSRPVVILKKFTEKMFWGIPTTTKIRHGEYRFRFAMNDVENDLLIWQTRSFDRKRLIRKIGMIQDSDFESLLNLVGRLFPEKTKTPEGVFSEAEASGCNISLADEIGLSNEFNYLLNRGEIK